jgi:hypothetical protein
MPTASGGATVDRCAERRGVLQREGFVDEPRVVGRRDVMQVARGRLHVGVAHPLLDAEDVGLGDHAGAEGVAQVVEAQRAQAGGGQSVHVAAAQCRAVDVAAQLADEDQIVVTVDQPRSTSRASAAATCVANGTERSRHALAS